MSNVTDGTSNCIMIGERPPSADGQKGWWDSRCCTEDNISAARGDRHIYSSGKSGSCPNPAKFHQGNLENRCEFNSLFSCHAVGGNFCFADGSVRLKSYDAGNTAVNTVSLLEALATRAGGEITVGDW